MCCERVSENVLREGVMKACEKVVFTGWCLLPFPGKLW